MPDHICSSNALFLYVLWCSLARRYVSCQGTALMRSAYGCPRVSCIPPAAAGVLGGCCRAPEAVQSCQGAAQHSGAGGSPLQTVPDCECCPCAQAVLEWFVVTNQYCCTLIEQAAQNPNCLTWSLLVDVHSACSAARSGGPVSWYSGQLCLHGNTWSLSSSRAVTLRSQLGTAPHMHTDQHP